MLRSATCISLAMDDRKYQKIVRFRCDAPKKPYMRRGILGVLGLQRSAVGDFEEDHALVATRKLDRFFKQVLHTAQQNKSAVGDRHRAKGAHTDTRASVCRGRSK